MQLEKEFQQQITNRKSLQKKGNPSWKEAFKLGKASWALSKMNPSQNF